MGNFFLLVRECGNGVSCTYVQSEHVKYGVDVSRLHSRNILRKHGGYKQLIKQSVRSTLSNLLFVISPKKITHMKKITKINMYVHVLCLALCSVTPSIWIIIFNRLAKITLIEAQEGFDQFL